MIANGNAHAPRTSHENGGTGNFGALRLNNSNVSDNFATLQDGIHQQVSVVTVNTSTVRGKFSEVFDCISEARTPNDSSRSTFLTNFSTDLSCLGLFIKKILSGTIFSSAEVSFGFTSAREFSIKQKNKNQLVKLKNRQKFNTSILFCK